MAKKKAAKAEVVQAEAVKVEAIAIQDQPVSAGLIQTAIQAGASIEVLERLLSLQERWEQAQAKKAFALALSAVRAEIPTVIKGNEVDYQNKNAPGRTRYRYEDLAAIVKAISPVIAAHGMTFRWKTDSQTAGAVKVTCIVSHAGGHSEETTLSCGLDHSGNKNDIQAIGSAVTYLQRYTLRAGFGVAAGVDDDAQSERRREPDEPLPPSSRVDVETKRSEQPWASTLISDPQRKRLYAIALKAGRKEEALKAWLQACGLESSREIERRHYEAVIAAVEAPGPLKVMVLKVRDREPGEEG